MVRWHSVLHLREESGLEGRTERVVDGVKEGNPDWLRLTLIFMGIAVIVWAAMVLIVNLLVY